MQAAWYSALGAASDVLEVGEVRTPEPGPGEVLVLVMASGVNPIDVKRRAGGRGGMSTSRVTPHFDGAGVVEAVGDGVEPGRVGERVWLYEAQWQRQQGTAAEAVVLPAHLAVPLPEAASFEEGACLGIPALTAHRCVFGDGQVEGKTVLVTGGAGCVGNYAVQFAALSGARVIATVSSEEKGALATRAGADAVINYRSESVPGAVSELTEGEGVDRIVEVEFGGNLADSVEVLKPRGVVAAYASQGHPEPSIPFYTMMYRNLVARFEIVFGMSEDAKLQALDDLCGWLEQGCLHHPTVQAFALDDVVQAHLAVEEGILGKAVINFAD